MYLNNTTIEWSSQSSLELGMGRLPLCGFIPEQRRDYHDHAKPFVKGDST